MEPAIGRTGFEDVRVWADRLDTTAAQDQDAIRVNDRGQPVRDDDDRHLSSDALDRLLNLALGPAVERARGLVEHEEGRLPIDRPSDSYPLTRAPRQTDPAVAEHGVEPLGQLPDELSALAAQIARASASGSTGR